MKSEYYLFAFFIFFFFFFFYELLEMCCFIFFENERVAVIKQSIMVLPVEKQYELSLIVVIMLKYQMSSSEVTSKCL